ncbi:MAG TPA: hypothetical protein VEO73_08055, partial [Gemmatimonadales bacterium]|nr:hypothetical protein [Gemmatimonadales bacterium]
MYAQRRLCAFSAALERVLAARDAAAFEAEWITQDLQQVGWEALALARQANTEALEPVLAQVDRRLLAVLERCRAFVDSHLVTFRVPELERWQHAAAAALVGARWGVAGLRTVIADTGAPVGRRYFAFLALAERHPPGAWGLFAKYLRRPDAHHAFVAAAVEAARYYPGHTSDLIAVFERIRRDQLRRRFLGPKILESLLVLGDATALPLFEELLVTGHTDPDVDNVGPDRRPLPSGPARGMLASCMRSGASAPFRPLLSACSPRGTPRRSKPSGSRRICSSWAGRRSPWPAGPTPRLSNRYSPKWTGACWRCWSAAARSSTRTWSRSASRNSSAGSTPPLRRWWGPAGVWPGCARSSP